MNVYGVSPIMFFAVPTPGRVRRIQITVLVLSPGNHVGQIIERFLPVPDHVAVAAGTRCPSMTLYRSESINRCAR